jgi:hypothetical protein
LPESCTTRSRRETWTPGLTGRTFRARAIFEHRHSDGQQSLHHPGGFPTTDRPEPRRHRSSPGTGRIARIGVAPLQPNPRGVGRAYVLHLVHGSVGPTSNSARRTVWGRECGDEGGESRIAAAFPALLAISAALAFRRRRHAALRCAPLKGSRLKNCRRNPQLPLDTKTAHPVMFIILCDISAAR